MSVLYSETGDGDYGSTVAAKGTSGECGRVGDGFIKVARLSHKRTSGL